MLKIVLPQRPTFFSTWGTKTETFPGWKWHSSSDATIWPPAVFLFSARRKAYNVILKNFPRVGKISTEITLRAYYCDTLKTWSLVHVSDFPESQVFTQNLVAGLPWWSMVKSLPFNAGGLPLWLRWWESTCNVETWVQSLGWEDPLEKGKATHSSILAERIPWTV